MSAEMDDRIPTLRWAKVNGKKKRHLWLGHETACGGLLYGDNVHRLEIAHPIPACGKCLAYARGWLSHHDTGDRPQLGKPDPTVSGTRLAPEGVTL